MTNGNGLMAGKRGLILGVANNRSIAWGIAKACANAGAELALTYQGDALKKRVEPLATELGAIVAGHCDVTDMDSVDAVFAKLEKEWGKIDFLVHAVAFSEWTNTSGNLPLWKDPRNASLHPMRARGDIPYDVRVKQRLLSRLWDPMPQRPRPREPWDRIPSAGLSLN